MEQQKFNGLIFVDSIEQYMSLWHPSHALHILCLEGSMSFTYHNTRYNVMRGELVIFQSLEAATEVSVSGNFKALLMSISDAFHATLAIRSNYGVIGALHLLFNPVISLKPSDFEQVHADMLAMRRRTEDCNDTFTEELIGHLLMAHILDLYRIYNEQNHKLAASNRSVQIMSGFFDMLYRGDYVEHRDIAHYADGLYITAHHLSDVCREVTHESALHWIDQFAMREIGRLLQDKQLSLTDIAEHMHFSSASYFTRYVTKHMGVPPSQLRQ